MPGQYAPARPTLAFQKIRISGSGFRTPVPFSRLHSRGKHEAHGAMNMPFPRPWETTAKTEKRYVY